VSAFQPDRIFAALDQAGVDYVTVGGFALIAHGVVRATEDVDIIPGPASANLSKLAAALQSLGASPHGEPATPLVPDLLDRAANMRFETEAGQVDVLLAEQYRSLFDDLREQALTVDVDGTPVIVVSRNDLIRLKAGSGRDRDVLDIGELLALDEG
jgi:hypothetical protein